MGAYSASKAGVISLSETLRAELALSARGMKVSVACPAFFQTNLMSGARAPDHDRKIALKLMAASKQSADDVAAAIYRGAMRGDFMLLPTATEPMRWRIKRWFPDLFLRKLLAAYGKGGKRS
jgi:short-subunit dehydrogenase